MFWSVEERAIYLASWQQVQAQQEKQIPQPKPPEYGWRQERQQHEASIDRRLAAFRKRNPGALPG